MDLRARRIKGPERSRSHKDWDEPLFVDNILNGPPPPPTQSKRPDDRAALDAYSVTITRVVDQLAPSVVNLQVTRRVIGGRAIEGGGSGVVITPDGYMLTSAHVVHGTDEALSRLPTVANSTSRSSVPTHCPTSQCCPLRPPIWSPLSSAMQGRSGWDS